MYQTPSIEMIDETGIKQALLNFIKQQYESWRDKIIIQEFALKHGLSRVDIAVLGQEIHGYEIKSDYDQLSRLSKQVGIYSEVLDKASLVVGQKHLLPGSKLIPEWWGLMLCFETYHNEVKIIQIRAAENNPSPSNKALAQLLWKNEVISLLEKNSVKGGLKSQRREHLYEIAAENFPRNTIRKAVVSSLTNRPDWKPD